MLPVSTFHFVRGAASGTRAVRRGTPAEPPWRYWSLLLGLRTVFQIVEQPESYKQKRVVVDRRPKRHETESQSTPARSKLDL